MKMKKTVASAALLLSTAGLVGLQAPAHADDDDDRKKRTWHAQGRSYTMILHEARDIRDDDALRATMKVNAKKAGKKWAVVMKRDGRVVHATTKRANRNGDVTFTKRFRGDDDDRVRVTVRPVGGTSFSRAMQLDD